MAFFVKDFGRNKDAKPVVGESHATSLEHLEQELREQLRTADTSLRAISEATGISKTHLANFKNAIRNLSFQNLDTLASYFGVRYLLKNF